ncbi:MULTISPECIES: sensor histidine kinase [Streptomyces]|uniref:sensor histidine kinase n=1 Tax=Streptomyces TaxID=1883 RepID=UPI001CCC87FA|nr:MULTISPECIES: histidine kinase [Streptomyces]UBI37493.1 histidine kinase [Streptomyces mobaraensis]UKW30082.1 histidine kinase [Streptomyces sp. TYQ1024]
MHFTLSSRFDGFRSRPAAVDLLVALVVQAAVTIPFAVPRAPGAAAAGWGAYGMTTLTVVPLLWRSRAPLAVLLLVVAAVAAHEPFGGPGQPLPYSPLVAVFTVAAAGGVRQRRAVLGLGMPLVVAGNMVHSDSVREHLFNLFVFGMAYALGSLARTRQAYTAAVEARAAELERSRQAEIERAAERERARIAREMHDILSHAVSLMIVQAEAGPLAVRSDPDRAVRAFDAISGAGRDAMHQLRRMLGLLEERGEGGGPRRSADGERAGRVPQPTLDRLGELVDDVRGTGLDVALEVEGEPVPLAADTQATVYRVVQEALTNVLRHADARTATVRLAWEHELLTVSVVDDGPGTGPFGLSGTSPTSGGRGLIGIRERAAAHGGAVVAGPVPGGRGFRVAVDLPIVICSPAEVGT